MKVLIALLFALTIGPIFGLQAFGDEFTDRATKIAEHKKWLDSLGSSGSRYWVRLDSHQRPHRLYVSDGFYRADVKSQEQFVDTFSHYLAGHPEKFMLIDLFDENTKKPVGEFGWGGFKLYPKTTGR
jgi:hypothetical protein